jgi:hypothetical protein
MCGRYASFLPADYLARLLHDFRRNIGSICAEYGADMAVLDSLLNLAGSVTRGGVIGTYQRAMLIEPTRKVMALWGLLREAIGLPVVAPIGRG